MNVDFKELEAMFADVTSNETDKKEEPPVIAPKQNTQIVGNPVLMSAIDKMAKIKTELNSSFQERTELINNMLLAITVGVNMVMLGAPGTGKTAITEELCNRIENANYFSWMLNKTSDPSEILGSFSIKEMENDRFMRITTGKLPEAHIAFVDEVYKSNSPTLNTLLNIMNEHYFYNDGKKQPVPLISMFGASNEPPEDESLTALHDRFIFRVNVKYLKDSNNKKKMYQEYINRRTKKNNIQKTTITLSEIKALQNAACNIKVKKHIMTEFIKLITKLNKEGIIISDRRQNECFKIMQGSAVLNKRIEVDTEDFRPLIYVLWEKEEQIQMIESIILKMVNPYEERFLALKTEFAEIKASIGDDMHDPKKSGIVLGSKTQIDKVIGKLNKLINEATSASKNVDEFIAFKDEMAEYGKQTIAVALSFVSPS